MERDQLVRIVILTLGNVSAGLVLWGPDVIVA